MTARKTIIDKQPEDLVKNLGHGVNAECFLTSEGRVFKRFFKPWSSQVDIQQMELLGGERSELFVFPEELLIQIRENKEYLIGYMMKYVDGKMVSELDRTVKVREFVKALSDFEKELFNLSMHGVLMVDINLMYSRLGKIIAIDTDLFEISYEDESYILRENVKDLASLIIYRIIQVNSFKQSKLNEYVVRTGAEGRMRPSYLIDEITKSIEEATGETISTFEDFDRGIQLIKK